jgi:HD-GYP domain-containing protein (c-di-GMP phosphodiesterase class II)
LVEALQAFRSDGRFWSSLSDPDVSAVEPPDHVLRADEARLDQVAEGFAAVIDAKSPWTQEHCDRVCAIAVGIATRMGLEEPALRELRRAALLHDLGKLSISNRILDKPGPLTDDERATFRDHPLLAEQILSRVPSLRAVAAVASAHHERLDGSGYPRGLTGDALTMPMRILAVADVYEALISERPYRAAHPPDSALELMRPDVPTGLDPDAFASLEAFVRNQAIAGPNALTGTRPALRRVK